MTLSYQDQIKQELHSCKQKLFQLQIKDVSKLLPLTKTTLQKNEVINIQQLEEKLEFERNKEKNIIYGSMKDIRSEINLLKSKLKKFEKNQNFLNEIEQISQGIEIRSCEFKDKMMKLFDSLADEEEKLNEDLEMLEETDTSCQQVTAVTVIQKENLKNVEFDDLKKRIDKIDLEIKKNGDKLCGWDREDHTDFLKIRTKHNGKMKTAQFVNDCLNMLPLKTEDMIQEHIQRYQKYLNLEEEKKELVAIYKQQKQELKQDLVEKAVSECEVPNVKKPIRQQSAQLREKQKEEIKQWKIKKESQKLVEEEQKKEEILEMKRMEQERIAQERERKRLQVEMFKQQKEYERQLKQQEDEYNQKVYVPESIKQRIQQREEQLVDKKKQKLEMDKQKKQEEEWKQQKRMEENKIKFGHVDTKLLNATKAAEQQKRAKYDGRVDGQKQADTFGGNLLGLGKRATPQWRQGL